MFFWEKREKWKKIKEKSPPANIEILLCDDEIQWIGMKYEITTQWDFDQKCYLIKDFLSKNGEFVFSSRHSNPIYWQHLSRLMKRE